MGGSCPVPGAVGKPINHDGRVHGHADAGLAQTGFIRMRGDPIPPAASTTVLARAMIFLNPIRPSDPDDLSIFNQYFLTRALVFSKAPWATASSTHSAAFHLARQVHPSIQVAWQSNARPCALQRSGFMNFGCANHW